MPPPQPSKHIRYCCIQQKHGELNYLNINKNKEFEQKDTHKTNQPQTYVEKEKRKATKKRYF